MKKTDIKKIVLAYSGGLDTSIIIPWLKENYNDPEIIAVAADVGQGDELEGLRARAGMDAQIEVTRFFFPNQEEPSRQGSGHREFTEYPDGFPIQQLAGDPFDGLGIAQSQPLGFGPGIHGKQAVEVGGGGDHRRGPQKGPDLAGQAVGPANVAGQEGNDKPPQLIYTEDGGVGSFAL